MQHGNMNVKRTVVHCQNKLNFVMSVLMHWTADVCSVYQWITQRDGCQCGQFHNLCLNSQVAGLHSPTNKQTNKQTQTERTCRNFRHK